MARHRNADLAASTHIFFTFFGQQQQWWEDDLCLSSKAHEMASCRQNLIYIQNNNSTKSVKWSFKLSTTWIFLKFIKGRRNAWQVPLAHWVSHYWFKGSICLLPWLWRRYHGCLHMYRLIKLYTLNTCSSSYINYISIKLLKNPNYCSISARESKKEVKRRFKNPEYRPNWRYKKR